MQRWLKQLDLLKCHPVYRTHVHPTVKFFWDLYPFKLICWDIALILDVIFCPICWFLWIPFQFMAVPFNMYFLGFLPCNVLAFIVNFTAFLIALPPGIIQTIFNNVFIGMFLAFFMSFFVATPAVFVGLYLWDSLLNAYYSQYCSTYLGYVGLSAYCTTI